MHPIGMMPDRAFYTSVNYSQNDVVEYGLLSCCHRRLPQPTTRLILTKLNK